jgi:hypothetical protein
VEAEAEASPAGISGGLWWTRGSLVISDGILVEKIRTSRKNKKKSK